MICNDCSCYFSFLGPCQESRCVCGFTGFSISGWADAKRHYYQSSSGARHCFWPERRRKSCSLPNEQQHRRACHRSVYCKLFCRLHNHRNNTEPSAGDLYGLINQNTPANKYDTRYVMTGGTIYAFVIYNADSADKFKNTFPPDQIGNNPPEFPTNASGDVFNEYRNALLYFQSDLGYSKADAGSLAMALIFERYKAGIAVVKRNSNGVFEIMRARQTSSSGVLGTFEKVNCN